MASALKLFEKVGISMDEIGKYLSEGVHGTGTQAQNYLVKGLGGAAVGGLGMGASSYLSGRKGDPDRFSRALGSGLSGAVLGGGVGVGAQALQDEMTRHPTPSPGSHAAKVESRINAARNLYDHKQAFGNLPNGEHGPSVNEVKNLDYNPMVVHHPYLQEGHDIFADPKPFEVAGAAGGLGVNGALGHATNKLYSANTQAWKEQLTKDSNKPGNPFATPDAKLDSLTKGEIPWYIKGRYMDKVMNNPGNISYSGIEQAVKNLGGTNVAANASLAHSMDNAYTSKALAGTQNGPFMQWLERNVKIPKTRFNAADLIRTTDRAIAGARPAARGIARAGVSGLAGAGVGYGVDQVGKSYVDSLINEHGPEQMRIYSAYGK